jgi:uncharacterized membrane protein
LISEILQLIGLLSAFCGLTVIYFYIAIYISIRSSGGRLEKKHTYVILGLAALFFAVSAILNILGSLTV